jgi:hypothetical protein
VTAPKHLLPRLTALTDWTAASAEAVVRAYAEEEGAKLGVVAQPLRAALTGEGGTDVDIQFHVRELARSWADPIGSRNAS